MQLWAHSLSFVPSNCRCVIDKDSVSLKSAWSSQVLGLSGWGKTCSCNSHFQFTVNSCCKGHFLPENSHLESCTTQPPILPQSLCGNCEYPYTNPFLRPCFGQRPVAWCSLSKWADTHEHWTLEFINPSNPNEGPDPCIHEIIWNFS